MSGSPELQFIIYGTACNYSEFYLLVGKMEEPSIGLLWFNGIMQTKDLNTVPGNKFVLDKC